MKITSLLKSILILTAVLAITACEQKKKKIIDFPKTDLAKENMIPKPLKINATNSAFGLDQNTVIHTSPDSEDLHAVAQYLSDKIKWHTQLDLVVNNMSSSSSDRVILIKQLEGSDNTNNEAYELTISQDSVILSATTAEGAFRGVQTLRQLIPEISNDTLSDTEMWLIPSGEIADHPNFEYRGSMLDVARHFFNVEDVKKYIDLLAYYKMNTLHLHLTDDQGWRIEIKSWPKLTEIGGSSEVGGGPGGFYTQEDYKDIVAYAAKQYITIIPEVDMPGHTNAASLAYPFLNGNGKKIEPHTGIEVGFSTFDTRKDTVYAFIDDVVREISEITPGPYFHAGGDESLVTKKADFNYFISRVDKIVKKYNKRMIGWDEIVHADIDTTAIAQFWSNEENAKIAVEKGMKVILAPGKKAYLDMKYDTVSQYGLHWAGYIPVDTAYIWTPEKYIKGINKEHILGIEAPLWSETITNMEELEYLAFPRVIGHAELGWSTEENRNWEDYKVRVGNQAPYLDKMNVKYYPSKLIDWKKSKHTYKTILKD
ncbi:family 20 glycosylhydrolase [Arenibacter certesii]|uniref:beta-N-acetylhexosaminidase n=1 Tax=Arenibacter certesii TaxID=228955 RepID=A0A918MJD5_9FLAO|nr:family 20 glycosylhydrolase [Arenibacter certesii]GGW26742.1 beta-N-acetylhexosaminidase [Arenibacter certesii]